MNISEQFSLRTFSYGLSAVAGVCVLIIAYCAAMSASTMRSMEGELSQTTVILEYISTAPHSPQGDHPASKPETTQHDNTPIQAEAHLDQSDMHDPEANADEAHSEPHALPEEHGDEYAEETHAATPEMQEQSTSGHESDEEVLKQSSQSLALAHAPIEGAYKEGQFGLLPKITAAGKTPFDLYRRNVLLNHNRPAVAIGVLDYGLSQSLSEQLLEKLPADVSLVLSPYSADMKDWQEKARADGHEIWLGLPMETAAFPAQDPGAKAIMSRLSLKANLERLEWIMSQTTGYAGIAGFSDRTVLKAEPMFKAVGQTIFKTGLAYFEVSPDRYSYFVSQAGENNSPSAHNYMHFDSFRPDSPAIKSLNEQIESMGGALFTITPNTQNIDNLLAWIKVQEDNGVQIVPVSAIAALSLEGLN